MRRARRGHGWTAHYSMGGVSVRPEDHSTTRIPRLPQPFRLPDIDKSPQVNLVWSGPGQLTREPIPPIPPRIAGRVREVSTDGKLVE